MEGIILQQSIGNHPGFKECTSGKDTYGVGEQMGMYIINFSHPITQELIGQIERISQQKVEQVFTIPVEFDNKNDFTPQMQELMKKMSLTPLQLQTEPILVNLPSLNFIAALLLADLHGRMGYFAPVLRIRSVEGSTPRKFEVAEILDLQTVRDNNRKERFIKNPT